MRWEARSAADKRARLAAALFFGILFLIAVVMVYEAVQLRPLRRMFPLGVLVPLTTLLLLKTLAQFTPAIARFTEAGANLFQGATPPKEVTEEASADPVEEGDPTTLQEFRAILWMLSSGTAVLLIGFLYGTTIFTFVYSYVYGRRSLLTSLLMAFLIGGMLYLMFTILVPLPLYRGILFSTY